MVMGFPGDSVSKESASNARDLGLISGSGKSLGEGSGNPLHCSSLEIPWTEEPGGRGIWGHKESDLTK